MRGALHPPAVHQFSTRPRPVLVRSYMVLYGLVRSFSVLIWSYLVVILAFRSPADAFRGLLRGFGDAQKSRKSFNINELDAKMRSYRNTALFTAFHYAGATSSNEQTQTKESHSRGAVPQPLIPGPAPPVGAMLAGMVDQARARLSHPETCLPCKPSYCILVLGTEIKRRVKSPGTRMAPRLTGRMRRRGALQACAAGGHAGPGSIHLRSPGISAGGLRRPERGSG
jgi:hypothetical protein